MGSLVVRSGRIVLPDGMRAASLYVRDGVIERVAPYGDRPAAVPVVDAGELVVMPGVVDSHVHVNDPGRAHWEGFDTATRAAAAGGVTTLVDMPLNSIPPTTTADGLAAKHAAAVGRVFVDVAFWGGMVPGNSAEFQPLARAGVRGFKCFLCPSGVDEFRHVTEADLRLGMPVIAGLGLPLLAHAELPDALRSVGGSTEAHETWRRSRPPEAERTAIALLVALSREFGTRVHIVHLASAEAVESVRQARMQGVRITGETCPHYLTFASEEIPDRATLFKCAPPIREGRQREALWNGLRRGDIDLIATDHSPAPPDMKHVEDGDFVRAWGGIASVQIGLAACWTGASARSIPLEAVSRWMSGAPARLAGLSASKGSISAGADADLVIWDPDATAVVDPATLLHRHPLTPYAGMRLRGVVRTTLLRGEIVFRDGQVLPRPQGKVIASPA